MCTFSQGFFSFFPPLLEDTWVHGTWIMPLPDGVCLSLLWVGDNWILLCWILPHTEKNIRVGLLFPRGAFLKAQAELKFNLKKLLGLTFRSLGSQSIVLATDPVPEVGWMVFDVNTSWQSCESEGLKPGGWNSEPVLNHKLKCTFNMGTWCILVGYWLQNSSRVTDILKAWLGLD